jgi:hypothetical protein
MLDFFQGSALQLSLWFAGTGILGIAIAFGIWKAGSIKGNQRRQLDRSTRAVQAEEDPQKQPR